MRRNGMEQLMKGTRFTFCFFLAVLGLYLSAPLSMAQIELTCRLEHSRVVQHESVRATVRIQNNTPHALRVSEQPGDVRLLFNIERSPGRLATRREVPLLEETLVIPPRRSETVQVILNEAYDVRSTGPYTIRARVDWQGTSFLSPGAFLDVVPGFELNRITAAASSDGSAYRTYRVLSLNRDRGEHVFLRIDDPSAGMTYGVIYLGRVVRQFKPRLDADGNFNVHVLHQSGPARFAHHVFTPNGRLVNRRFYTSDAGGVAFEQAPDGSISITGAAASFSE